MAITMNKKSKIVLALATVLLLSLSGCSAKKQVIKDDENNDFDEEEIDVDSFAPIDDDDEFGDVAAEDNKDDTKSTGGKGIKIFVSHCPSLTEKLTFAEYETRIKHLYPNVQIEGNATESPEGSRMMVLGVDAIQFGTMGFCLMGRRLFGMMGMETPAFMGTIEQSPMAPAMLVYFMANRLKDQLRATNTFEVFVNGELVFSKLEKGRIPTWPEFLYQLQAAGLPRVQGADDEAMFPSGWAEQKQADASIASDTD